MVIFHCYVGSPEGIHGHPPNFIWSIMVPVKIAKFSDPKKIQSKTSHLRTTVLRRQMQSLFEVGMEGFFWGTKAHVYI